MAAVDQLGIAETVVNTVFIGLVAMVVLAAGLAFGLGGQQTAAQITASWYASGRQAGARIAEYAHAQSQQPERAGLGRRQRALAEDGTLDRCTGSANRTHRGLSTFNSRRPAGIAGRFSCAATG